MRIFLIGYMFSGKSTIGYKLAKRLGYPFSDLDQTFEERYHLSIAQFFQRYDEAAFRQIETQLLRQAATSQSIVISCGGGTPCHGDNMRFIKQQGRSIYLQLSAEEVLARHAASHRKEQRPLLNGLSPEQQRQRIALQLSQRDPIYRQADYTLNSFSQPVDALVEQILHDCLSHSVPPAEAAEPTS